MNRAAAGTAMVLTAIVAVRLLQPAAVQAPSAASTSAQQIASTATGEAKARAADGKPVRARTAARVSRDERTHRARTGAKHIEASGLVRTNSAASDRPVDFAAPRQQASEGGHAVTAQASPVAEAPVTAKAASPAQICADRSNFISRGFCENQVCLKAEWKDQPYCVKKREQDLRLNPVLAISN